jgi:hypothetical protein
MVVDADIVLDRDLEIKSSDKSSWIDRVVDKNEF